MKFTGYIQGDFTKIKGCLLVPRFEVTVECGQCKKIKEGIRIDEEKTVTRQWSKKKDPARYNFKMQCECGIDICINANEIENKIGILNEKGEDEIFVNPVDGDKCELVRFWTEGGVITAMDNIQLTIIADNLERFDNVDISKRMVVEEGKDTQCFIENFQLKLK